MLDASLPRPGFALSIRRRCIEDRTYDVRSELKSLLEELTLASSDIDDRRDSREVVGHQNHVGQHREHIRHTLVERIRNIDVLLWVVE